MPLVLSLFPGLGVLDEGFRLEGFCVVSAGDLASSSLYDVRKFHPPRGAFVGVIGGPPCPAHSRLREQIRANGYTPAQDLVHEMERIVREAQPEWWLMENAPACRVPKVRGYKVHAQRFDNHWLGQEQGRVRLIAFGTRDGVPLELRRRSKLPARKHVVTADPRPVPVAIGGSGKRKPGADLPKRSLGECLRLQGLPEDLLDYSPMTMGGKRQLVGNAVPLPMARALARAVKEALR